MNRPRRSKHRRPSPRRAQLAIGIAFAFAAFLAMFGLIFNSSWLVREKMQLQQASDYAALRGAYVQKVNLDFIRDRNEDIQRLYAATEIALKLPYCWQIIAAAGGQMAGTVALSTSITQKASTTCTDACANYEAFVRDRIMNVYQIAHKNLAAQILTSVVEANAIALDEAKSYFFSRENVPYGLRNDLKRRLGAGFGSAAAKRLYESGALSELVALRDGQDPALQPDRTLLFEPAAERKLIAYPKYAYTTVTNGPVQYCPAVPFVSGAGAAPTTRKIARTGEEHTTFLFGAEYARVRTDVERTFNLGVYDLRDRKAATSGTGREARLFDKRSYPMISWSMAKPFGGQYPKAGDMVNPFDPGVVGEPFKGIKLIGLADRDEQGTKLRSLALSGEAYGLQPMIMEEFLH